MYVTVLLIALSGFSVPPVVVETPAWLTDYSEARQRGKEERKPLAVFIGSGLLGWEQVSRTGKLSQEAQQILASDYVCVYVDTSQPAGKRLAAAFTVPDGLGMVISDFSGELQAFRHEGDLAEQDLNHYLRRYADPDRVVRTTDSNPGRRVSYYPAEPAAAWQPVSAPPPGFYPRYFGASRGGC